MMPGQVSDFWGFKPPILAVVPATLPLAQRVFNIQVSYPFSELEATEPGGGRTAHFNPEEIIWNFNGISLLEQNGQNGWTLKQTKLQVHFLSCFGS